MSRKQRNSLTEAFKRSVRRLCEEWKRLVLAVRASAVERNERLQDLFCSSVGFVLSP